MGVRGEGEDEVALYKLSYMSWKIDSGFFAFRSGTENSDAARGGVEMK